MAYNSIMIKTSTAPRRIRFLTILFLHGGLLSALMCPPVLLAAQEDAVNGASAAKLDPAVKSAVDFLREAQADDGSFSASSGPGVTAIVATALLRSGLTANDPVVNRSLQYLQQHVHDDGGIYAEGSRYKNYETSLSIVCFQEANRDGTFDKLLGGAEKFVKQQQWDEDEGHEISSMSYGGAGYGSHERPDLSNTSFLVDALHSIGRGEDDPALEKALIFISRCQNLESEHNTSAFAAKVNDGGFYYTSAAGGQSQAGQTPEGGLRSYGSMTYAGLKSMIYAGVSRDDPRVKAAYKWIQKHYTFAENPGMGDNGLFYYYHTFAKALDTIGDDQITDAEGTSHEWRTELVDKLVSLQKDDGSWVNGNPRWLEGDPNLVTSYALLAISYCRPADEKSPPIDHIVPPPGAGRRVN
jgi:squalene-hopene/tetraprenyl-beta-curcumene cyclase